MLTNFIRTVDLEALYPDILAFHRNRGGGNDDLSYQASIDKAFDTMVKDFQMRGRNVRNMMVPIDLNRVAGTNPRYQSLTATTFSGNSNGYGWSDSKARHGRFSVNVRTKDAGTAWTVRLQGSNESAQPADDSAYWEDVATLTIADGDAGGERNTTFARRFLWYRRVVTSTGGAGDITLTATVEETTFDDLIVNKAIEIICSGITTGASPMWETRLARAMEQYDSGIKSVQYSVDDDEDGSPEGDPNVSGAVGMWR